MNGRRQAAFEDFCRLGFPTRREERYKYTDVAQAFAPDYGLNLRQAAPAPQVLARFRCNLPNLSPLVFYVANDTFPAEPSGNCPVGFMSCRCARPLGSFRLMYAPITAVWPIRQVMV